MIKVAALMPTLRNTSIVLALSCYGAGVMQGFTLGLYCEANA